MKDINFDELDKAVNSVLEANDKKSDKPSPDAAQDASKPADDTPADAPSSDDASSKPEPDHEEPAESEESSEKPTEASAAPALAKPATSTPKAKPAASPPVDKGRRSGQFMDVVHPATATSKKPELMSRSGKDLKPLSGDVKPEEPSAQQPKPAEEPPKTDTPAPAAVEPVAPGVAEEPVLESAATKPEAVEPVESKPMGDEQATPAAPPAPTPATQSGQDWPDPLDVHGFKYDESDKKEDTKEPEPADNKEAEAPAPAPEPQEAQPAAEEQPEASNAAATPFITDAKVEKRPLGAFASNEADDKAKPETDEQPPVDDPQQPAQVPTQAEKLPPELSKDVLAVEAGEFSSHDANEPKEGETPEQTEKPPAPEENEADQSDSALSATASIPQQYKEQPAQAEKEDSAHHGFNKDYHDTPLLESPHHGNKHAVLWIALAIIILVATGAYFAWWYFVATA